MVEPALHAFVAHDGLPLTGWLYRPPGRVWPGPAMLSLHQSPERFGQMICDQFDVLYEDGAKTGRVMSICTHPFLLGHPHRSKYFAKALAHITSRQDVWLATGSEIIDWYKQHYLKR